jgi:hypothetical protein
MHNKEMKHKYNGLFSKSISCTSWTSNILLLDFEKQTTKLLIDSLVSLIQVEYFSVPFPTAELTNEQFVQTDTILIITV